MSDRHETTGCAHLTRLDGEWLALDGSTGPAVVHGCDWIDAHPERLVGAPRWLQEQALAGGPTFSPAKHCPGCPGFRATEALANE